METKVIKIHGKNNSIKYLTVDTSDLACFTFGFKSGQKISLPEGNATVMGVALDPFYEQKKVLALWLLFEIHDHEGDLICGYLARQAKELN